MSILDLDSELPIQDYIVLAGKRSPGRATVRGASSPRKWDEQAGYAQTGATLIYTGKALAKIEVDIYLWIESQFAEWTRFAQATLIDPKPVLTPSSLSIQHPMVNREPLYISQVVVDDVTQWEQDDSGGFQCTIKLHEFRPRKPALVKPREGPPGSPVVVTPNPRLAVLAANQAQIARLGGP
jgi:hypothetical protein